jgi:hypothetical protein
MKFIFADSLDYVDPRYDFIQDRNGPGRKPYWDDAYPHEILGYAPYDGVLVSRGIIGGHGISGKYTEAQAMRFRRVGARAFLRLDRPEFAGLDIFGDCGAFTYSDREIPPYTPEEMAEFYDDGRFTHGCSVDHIIFDFDAKARGLEGGSADAHRRFDITLENAEAFLKATNHLAKGFTPLGAIQGWSAGSMAAAASRLVKMGYTYLAVGGMVPLKAEQIRQCLSEIRAAIPARTRLHILGFAKADEISTFLPFDITSFDTTSPLIRAFKDAKQNFYLPAGPGKLRYFTAIRIPQSIENPRLQRLVKQGDFRAEDLTALEGTALGLLRAYDRGEAELAETLEAILEYNSPLATDKPYKDTRNLPTMMTLANRYTETLSARPWKQCACPICQTVSVEVMIFRASNRNKRRGIHNLGVFKTLVDQLQKSDLQDETGHTDLFRSLRSAKC